METKHWLAPSAGFPCTNLQRIQHGYAAGEETRSLFLFVKNDKRKKEADIKHSLVKSRCLFFFFLILENPSLSDSTSFRLVDYRVQRQRTEISQTSIRSLLQEIFKKA